MTSTFCFKAFTFSKSYLFVIDFWFILKYRARRRQARALSGNCDHQEGTSSDDELSSADLTDFQKSQGQSPRF